MRLGPVSLADELAWVREVDAKFSQGIPEPAWDGAGDLLELLLTVLEEVEARPEIARAIEARIQARRESIP